MEEPDSPFLVSLSHRAMATDFVVMLPKSCSQDADLAFQALESIDDIEAALTIYQSNSEISRLNRDGAKTPVALSKSTFDLLLRAKQWSEHTSGGFDITTGPLIDAWGFTSRSGKKPSDSEISAARVLVGFEQLILDAADGTAKLAQQGVRVNLGAIGKGHALDLIAAELREQGMEHFLIHGGNSSIIAVGDQLPGSGDGWAVGIAHPTKPNRRIGGIKLRNQALGTSGSGKQFFHHQGKRFGHVIDPRTGYPAGDLLSLTVVADSATDADAAATGCFVMGWDSVMKLDHQELGLAMIAVKPSKRQDEVAISTLGMIDFIDPPCHQN